jgi:hypothetical protein
MATPAVTQTHRHWHLGVIPPNQTFGISQELRDQRAADLCFNFALGKCIYGDRCKFNHDVAAYAASKLPDLPGHCPFFALPTCPYGMCLLISACITCSSFKTISCLLLHAQPTAALPPHSARCAFKPAFLF